MNLYSNSREAFTNLALAARSVVRTSTKDREGIEMTHDRLAAALREVEQQVTLPGDADLDYLQMTMRL